MIWVDCLAVEGERARLGPSEILWDAPQDPSGVEGAGTSAVFRTSASLVLSAYRAASQQHSVRLVRRTSSDVVQECAVADKARTRRGLGPFSERRGCSKDKKAPRHQPRLMGAQTRKQGAPEIEKGRPASTISTWSSRHSPSSLGN